MSQTGRVGGRPQGQATHERIVDWLAAQPYRVRLRMNSIGEPFASKDYLRSVARLTRAENLSLVEVLTNGSFRKEQSDRFAAECDVQKLSLWITFHHQFIGARELADTAEHTRSRGVWVVVNTLVFPDNLAAVEELVTLCAGSASSRSSRGSASISTTPIPSRVYPGAAPAQPSCAGACDLEQSARRLA